MMLGSDNPWAGVAYAYCVAGAEYLDGVLSLALDVFVHIPMVKCVCKDAAGSNIRAYVETTCAPQLPATLRPTLFMIVHAIQASTSSHFKQLACDAVVADLQMSMKDSMTPTFSALEGGLEALHSVVDYLLVPFDKDSGHCLDLAHDPHIVVLVPTPTDYFMRCAVTQQCQQTCPSEWAAFSRANSTPIDLPDLSVQAESLFFPGQLDPSLVLSNATAITEIPPAPHCVDRGASMPSDHCVAVAQFGSSSLQVQLYCIPQVPGGSLYLAQTGGYGPFRLPGDIMDIKFLLDYTVVALLLRVDAGNVVALLTPQGLQTLPAPPIPSGYALVRIVSLWVARASVVIDVVTRTFVDTEQVASQIHFTYAYHANSTSAWRRTTIDLSQFAGQYWPTALSSGQFLLLPMLSGLPAYETSFEVAQGVLRMQDIVPVASLDTFPFQSQLSGCILAAESLSPTSVFAASQAGWNWLLQVRLDGSATQVRSSTPVTTTLKQQVWDP